MRRPIFAALLLLGLVAAVTWQPWRGERWTFSFTAQQLEAELAARFPMRKSYLTLVQVDYDHPRVRLTAGSDAIGMLVEVHVALGAKPEELRGSADLVAKVAYDAGSGTFVLDDAAVVALHVDGVDPGLRDRVEKLANDLAHERVTGVPLRTLQASDVKAAIDRLVLVSATVRDDVLRVELGL